MIEECDDEWAKIEVDGSTGYMMRKFLKEDVNLTIDTVTVTLNYNIALALYTALQSVVKE